MAAEQPTANLALVMDRAYEDDATRQLALDLGFVPVVPPKSNRLEPWEYDREMYKRRNEVERLFRRLKGLILIVVIGTPPVSSGDVAPLRCSFAGLRHNRIRALGCPPALCWTSVPASLVTGTRRRGPGTRRLRPTR